MKDLDIALWKIIVGWANSTPNNFTKHFRVNGITTSQIAALNSGDIQSLASGVIMSFWIRNDAAELCACLQNNCPAANSTRHALSEIQVLYWMTVYNSFLSVGKEQTKIRFGVSDLLIELLDTPLRAKSSIQVDHLTLPLPLLTGCNQYLSLYKT